MESRHTADGVPTYRVPRETLRDTLRELKPRHPMLFDLTAVDERRRAEPEHDFTLVYHLLSLDPARAVRLEVPLHGEHPSVPTVTDLWPAANWYEREAWDMFGIDFAGHPHLRRLLMPPWWEGHPLRKEHPARATEMERPARLLDDEPLRFRPEDWGLSAQRDGDELMFLNVGPQHPGTHGVLRVVLQLDGEVIVDAVPDIGFHHRAAEKMGERQTWHTYLPYTDRVDYLGGVMNNLPYCLAVEALGGIEVPERAKVIRVMLCELFRLASHLVWYGTFAQDVGALSPVFYMFTDRERIFQVVESVTGARMHPSWFRIGGVAADLPRGWDGLVRGVLETLPKRLDDYDRMVMRSRIFKARTVGVGAITLAEAVEWGVTGPGLRACGLEWDLRKRLPYGGYDQLDFEVPTATHGDCYDRAVVRVAEMRQSLRIIQQCVDGMPPGPVKAEHALATPPEKARTMADIETLIDHFLGVSWGPVIPRGEALGLVEGTKGLTGYYLVSDGGTQPYRVRIRAPSFAHMQLLPKMVRGAMVADLLAVLGAMDYVLAEVDR